MEATASSVTAKGLCDTSALKRVCFQCFRLHSSCLLIVIPRFNVLKSHQVGFLSYQMLHSNYKITNLVLHGWRSHGPIIRRACFLGLYSSNGFEFCRSLPPHSTWTSCSHLWDGFFFGGEAMSIIWPQDWENVQNTGCYGLTCVHPSDTLCPSICFIHMLATLTEEF